MYTNDGDIYRIPRQTIGYTQEHAAELLGLSVESIRCYESGARIPTDETVIRMTEVYNAQYLGTQHLRYASALARSVVPELELRDLPAAILRLQKEVNDVLSLREEMIGITCDGVISEAERDRWSKILCEWDDVARAIMALKFAKEVTG